MVSDKIYMYSIYIYMHVYINGYQWSVVINLTNIWHMHWPWFCGLSCWQCFSTKFPRLELFCAPGKEASNGGLVQDDSLIPAGFRRVFSSLESPFSGTINHSHGDHEIHEIPSIPLLYVPFFDCKPSQIPFQQQINNKSTTNISFSRPHRHLPRFWGHLSGEVKDMHLWRALSEVDPAFAAEVWDGCDVPNFTENHTRTLWVCKKY